MVAWAAIVVAIMVQKEEAQSLEQQHDESLAQGRRQADLRRTSELMMAGDIDGAGRCKSGIVLCPSRSAGVVVWFKYV
jgi:hypothetical protein